jgi:hypothetical protein
MGELTVQYVLLAIVVSLILLVVLATAARTYWKYRGSRIITCPETQRPAGIDVDALYVAMTATANSEHPRLRLADCSRWPEKKNCGQDCLAQVEAAPESCLVRMIVARWYADKACVFCGRPLAESHWYEHKPALMDTAGKTVPWSNVPPADLPDVLRSHKPVCWNCHIAETFRREHPELVVERDARTQSSRPRETANAG